MSVLSIWKEEVIPGVKGRHLANNVEREEESDKNCVAMAWPGIETTHEPRLAEPSCLMAYSGQRLERHARVFKGVEGQWLYFAASLLHCLPNRAP
jgi:hypothetical protein